MRDLFSAICENHERAPEKIVWKNVSDSEKKMFLKMRNDLVKGAKEVLQEKFTSVLFRQVGSTTELSDIDISVESTEVGKGVYACIHSFNKAFEEVFTRTSGEALDVNLYGYSHVSRFKDSMMPCAQSFGDVSIYQSNERRFSLGKLLFMRPQIKTKINDVSKALTSDKNLLNDIDDADDISHEMGYISRLDAINRNRVYEQRLKDIEDAIANKCSCEELCELIAKANMAAPEAAITGGCLLHVVYKLQMGLEIEIPREMAVDSFIENAADCFSKIDALEQNNVSCEDGVNILSKYFFRMLDAFERTRKERILPNLKESANQMNDKTRGRSDQEELKNKLVGDFMDQTGMEKCTFEALREKVRVVVVGNLISLYNLSSFSEETAFR